MLRASHVSRLASPQLSIQDSVSVQVFEMGPNCWADCYCAGALQLETLITSFPARRNHQFTQESQLTGCLSQGCPQKQHERQIEISRTCLPQWVSPAGRCRLRGQAAGRRLGRGGHCRPQVDSPQRSCSLGLMGFSAGWLKPPHSQG